MPKFKWDRFAEAKFGQRARYHDLKFRMLSAIPLGFEVRRSIRKRPGNITGTVTFRVRRGNGAYGAVLKKKYQDKYKYTPAMAAINTGSTPTKARMASGVAYWKTTLTADQKKTYNRRANRGMHMSGYNLFLREWLKTA